MTFFEWFYKVLIVQTVCVLVLFLSVVFAKYFLSETYVKITDFYKRNFTTDTSISEVLDGEI